MYSVQCREWTEYWEKKKKLYVPWVIEQKKVFFLVVDTKWKVKEKKRRKNPVLKVLNWQGVIGQKDTS